MREEQPLYDITSPSEGQERLGPPADSQVGHFASPQCPSWVTINSLEHLFFHEFLFRTPKRALATALGCVATLLISAPILPMVADWVRVRGLLHTSMLIMFIVPLIYIFAYLIYQVRVAHLPAYFILLLTLIVAVALTLPERETPEHVHVLVYALLSLFFYKIYSFYWHGIAAYALPLMTVFAIGVIDEFVQGQIPGRYMSVRDISDNSVGAFVGITFVYIRRHYGAPRIRKRRG